MAISAQKLKLIHVARRELDLSEEAYREILRHHGAVSSSKELDDEGFKRVLDCMKALGFWVERKWEQTRPRDPGDVPTPGQLKVIEHLWHDLSEYEPGAAHTPFRRGLLYRTAEDPCPRTADPISSQQRDRGAKKARPARTQSALRPPLNRPSPAPQSRSNIGPPRETALPVDNSPKIVDK